MASIKKIFRQKMYIKKLCTFLVIIKNQLEETCFAHIVEIAHYIKRRARESEKKVAPNRFLVITKNVHNTLVYNFCLKIFLIKAIHEEVGELKNRGESYFCNSGEKGSSERVFHNDRICAQPYNI